MTRKENLEEFHREVINALKRFKRLTAKDIFIYLKFKRKLSPNKYSYSSLRIAMYLRFLKRKGKVTSKRYHVPRSRPRKHVMLWEWKE